jgi:hypothetical protein
VGPTEVNKPSDIQRAVGAPGAIRAVGAVSRAYIVGHHQQAERESGGHTQARSRAGGLQKFGSIHRHVSLLLELNSP